MPKVLYNNFVSRNDLDKSFMFTKQKQPFENNNSSNRSILIDLTSSTSSIDIQSPISPSSSISSSSFSPGSSSSLLKQASNNSVVHQNNEQNIHRPLAKYSFSSSPSSSPSSCSSSPLSISSSPFLQNNQFFNNNNTSVYNNSNNNNNNGMVYSEYIQMQQQRHDLFHKMNKRMHFNEFNIPINSSWKIHFDENNFHNYEYGKLN